MKCLEFFFRETRSNILIYSCCRTPTNVLFFVCHAQATEFSFDRQVGGKELSIFMRERRLFHFSRSVHASPNFAPSLAQHKRCQSQAFSALRQRAQELVWAISTRQPTLISAVTAFYSTE